MSDTFLKMESIQVQAQQMLGVGGVPDITRQLTLASTVSLVELLHAGQ